MRRRTGAVPDSIQNLEEQLQQFRSTHPVRSRLPEALWQSAVEAARQHGIYVVARTLRLDYANLQKRMGDGTLAGSVRRSRDRDAGAAPQRRKPIGSSTAPSPAFLELPRSAGVEADEYVVEFESGAGLRMQVRWRGTTLEWSTLLRAWREVAG